MIFSIDVNTQEIESRFLSLAKDPWELTKGVQVMLFDDFRYFAPDFTEWHLNSYSFFVNVNEALMAYFFKAS